MIERRQIGIVSSLWRYPVKSMRGEPLATASITEHGALGDRVWALREMKYGGIMSARTWAAMLHLSAAYSGDAADGTERVIIRLPDGRTIAAEDPDSSATLSDLFRREVRLERVRSGPLKPAEIATIMQGDGLVPRRDFFDEDVLHVIASGTLDHLRKLRSASDFDRRRFRANIYVDTGDSADAVADGDGFVEDSWLNGILEIGEVRINGLCPALRCAMTTHPQEELPHDPAILRTAWQHHQAYVGVFAGVGATGIIKVGDVVTLATES